MQQKTVFSGGRNYCNTPIFEPSESKMKKINNNLILLGKELVFTECQSVNF